MNPTDPKHQTENKDSAPAGYAGDRAAATSGTEKHAAAAPARSESSNEEQTETTKSDDATTSSEEPPDKAKAAGYAQETIVDQSAEKVTGFSPFRFWLNRKIRQSPITLMHGGEERIVEELTVDGQLRLTVGEGAAVVPFDERYIPLVLNQLEL